MDSIGIMPCNERRPQPVVNVCIAEIYIFISTRKSFGYLVIQYFLNDIKIGRYLFKMRVHYLTSQTTYDRQFIPFSKFVKDSSTQPGVEELGPYG